MTPSFKEVAIQEAYGQKGWSWDRCHLCGKLLVGEWPGSVNLYDEEQGVHTICLDHGGEEGKAYIDALTSYGIEAPPAPARADKLLADAKLELRHWSRFLVRYYFYRAVTPFWWLWFFLRRCAIGR